MVLRCSAQFGKPKSCDQAKKDSGRAEFAFKNIGLIHAAGQYAPWCAATIPSRQALR
jgi:hypothetical protein